LKHHLSGPKPNPNGLDDDTPHPIRGSYLSGLVLLGEPHKCIRLSAERFRVDLRKRLFVYLAGRP
jgi:hypothetical protein